MLFFYSDFSKAFDSVDHSTLLSKIIHFGFDKDLVKPINSYLSSSSRCVKLDCFYQQASQLLVVFLGEACWDHFSS